MRDLASFICCSSMKRIFLFTVFLRQMFKVAIISTFWIATTFCLAQRSKWHDRNCAWQFVSVTLYFFGLFQTVKKMCRDANLKKWKSGRSPTFVCLTLKVKILRSNLKNSSNMKKKLSKDTKSGQNMWEKCILWGFFGSVWKIWWLVPESGRFGLYLGDSGRVAIGDSMCSFFVNLHFE